MKKLLTGTALSLALVLLPVHSAHTQGIPVIDTSQIAQVIATLQQQLKDYEEQIKQLTTMQDQLTNMQERLEAITGAKGISGILNGTAEKAARQAASDLQSIVNGAISGNGFTADVDGEVGNFLGDVAVDGTMTGGFLGDDAQAVSGGISGNVTVLGDTYPVDGAFQAATD